jgi:hypothetical protein
MLCWRRSNGTSDSSWPGRVRSSRYATSSKRRWDPGRGEGFGGDWDRIGCAGSGGQECGRSGPSLRRARARVAHGWACRIVGSTGGRPGGGVGGRGGGRKLHRRVALRRYGACCDGLGLLYVLGLQRMVTEGDNGYVRVVACRVGACRGRVGNGWWMNAC